MNYKIFLTLIWQYNVSVFTRLSARTEMEVQGRSVMSQSPKFLNETIVGSEEESTVQSTPSKPRDKIHTFR